MKELPCYKVSSEPLFVLANSYYDVTNSDYGVTNQKSDVKELPSEPTTYEIPFASTPFVRKSDVKVNPIYYTSSEPPTVLANYDVTNPDYNPHYYDVSEPPTYAIPMKNLGPRKSDVKELPCYYTLSEPPTVLANPNNYSAYSSVDGITMYDIPMENVNYVDE